jgi:acetyl/propionyl-CoA carboxylase alpha subunit
VLLATDEFIAGEHTTRTVEEGDVLAGLVAGDGSDRDDSADVLLVGGRGVRLWNPAMSASASAAVHGAVGSGEVVAPMQGTILKVLVDEGRAVASGEALMVLEAMKMETTIAATAAGTVAKLEVGPGDIVAAGQSLVIIE